MILSILKSIEFLFCVLICSIAHVYTHTHTHTQTHTLWNNISTSINILGLFSPLPLLFVSMLFQCGTIGFTFMSFVFGWWQSCRMRHTIALNGENERAIDDNRWNELPDMAHCRCRRWRRRQSFFGLTPFRHKATNDHKCTRAFNVFHCYHIQGEMS